MKIAKLALVVGAASLVWIVMAIHRWWFVYPDNSQLLLALLIGCIGLGGSYVYHWMRSLDSAYKEARDYFNNRYDVLYDEIQELRGKKE